MKGLCGRGQQLLETRLESGALAVTVRSRCLGSVQAARVEPSGEQVAGEEK